MRVQPVPQRSRLRRGVVTATGVALAAAFIAYGGTAAASPGPTASQVQRRITKLMSKLDAVAQQYDQSIGELKAANSRLALVDQQLSKNQANFEAMRAAAAQIAAAAYEQGGMNSASTLLTANNPQAVLDRAALLNHLSSDRQAQITAFINAARALRSSQLAEQRTQAAIAQLKKSKAAQRKYLRQLLAKNQAELNKLTNPNGIGASSGGIVYTGPATGAARVAVSFALAQVGKPYEWGATGPNAYDCSGLVMTAWAQAGVSIPRTTYDQWAALPHIPTSSLQPGDLLYYDAEGHVSMYVGNGMIVDAPQAGENVEEIPMSSPWYAQNYDGAVRP